MLALMTATPTPAAAVQAAAPRLVVSPAGRFLLSERCFPALSAGVLDLFRTGCPAGHAER